MDDTLIKMYTNYVASEEAMHEISAAVRVLEGVLIKHSMRGASLGWSDRLQAMLDHTWAVLHDSEGLWVEWGIATGELKA